MPSPVKSPLVQSPHEGFFVYHEKNQENLHSSSNCATCAKVQDDLAILQGLVFEVHKEVDDLHSQLEVLE